MKKIFQIVGITTLMIGSFLFTYKVQTASKMTDELLNEIKSKKDGYKENPIEPYIKDKTIVPGINGREVDVLKSYKKMSEVGYFDDSLFEYKAIYVEKKLDKNKDKYIIGLNGRNMNVSLIFKIDDSDDITNLVKKLDNNNMKVSFFITSKYLEKHHNQIIKLVQNGYTIGNLSNNENYEDSDFVWMKTIITNIGNQKYNYCFTNKENNKIMKMCKLQDSYTIMSDVIKSNPLLNIKKTLSPGKIIVLDYNSELSREIDTVLDYIKSKGYSLISLEEGLKE
ncbi:MAG: hypothetical protein IKF01_01315 [Bacilli bacterium]|nr:hypothetical protein [Bacilli bacterium]